MLYPRVGSASKDFCQTQKLRADFQTGAFRGTDSEFKTDLVGSKKNLIIPPVCVKCRDSPTVKVLVAWKDARMHCAGLSSVPAIKAILQPWTFSLLTPLIFTGRPLIVLLLTMSSGGALKWVAPTMQKLIVSAQPSHSTNFATL